MTGPMLPTPAVENVPHAGAVERGEAPTRAAVRAEVQAAIAALHDALKAAEEAGVTVSLRVSASGRWVSGWVPLDAAGDR